MSHVWLSAVESRAKRATLRGATLMEPPHGLPICPAGCGCWPCLGLGARWPRANHECARRRLGIDVGAVRTRQPEPTARQQHAAAGKQLRSPREPARRPSVQRDGDPDDKLLTPDRPGASTGRAAPVANPRHATPYCAGAPGAMSRWPSRPVAVSRCRVTDAAFKTPPGGTDLPAADGARYVWSVRTFMPPYSATRRATSKASYSARSPALSRSSNPAAARASTSSCTRR